MKGMKLPFAMMSQIVLAKHDYILVDTLRGGRYTPKKTVSSDILLTT
jgi:hypothetical protein